MINTDQFEKILSKKTLEVMITPKDDGYIMFNRFLVTASDNYYEVLDIKYSSIEKFTSIKNAITWAILTNCGKHSLARRILRLDLKLTSIKVELDISKSLYKTAEDKEIVWLKFHDIVYNKKMIQNEIEEITNKAKHLQERQFNTPIKSSKFSHWR
jgi:hypothetical protein